MPDVEKGQFIKCHNNTITQSDTENEVEVYSSKTYLVKGKIVPEDNMQKDI